MSADYRRERSKSFRLAGIESLESRRVLSASYYTDLFAQLSANLGLPSPYDPFNGATGQGTTATVNSTPTGTASASGGSTTNNTSNSQMPTGSGANAGSSTPAGNTQSGGGTSSSGNISSANGGSQSGNSAGLQTSSNSGNSSVVRSVSQARTLAFHDAAGFGAYAQGGRGGDVYHVTNLNDRGPGSLREGVTSATGPRTIVFDTSGTIDLASRLVIEKPYMTLAGQTAPGDGITLRNHGTVVSNTHDVVIQYMRFRTGDSFVSNHDTLSVFRSHDVMIDHVSASWGIDETLPVANSTNVTVQWSFITEGLHDSFHYKGPHSAGTLKYDGDVSFHHNLFAHHMWRSPLVRQNTDLVNNVIYDWGAFGTMVGSHTNDQYGPTSANVVNNYYVAGPSTEDPRDMFLGYAGSSVFASGNVLDVNLNGVRDGAAATYFQGQSRLVSGRFDFPSVPTQDALTAYQSVINEAGASLVRDAVDERIVAEVESDSGGIIDSPHDVGGWPVLFSEPAPLDSDRDGLPDAWENSFGRWYLDSDDASDGRKDQNADGTTNLEEYLQFLSDGGSVESLGGATTSMSSTTVSMSDFQLSMRQATANDWRNIINQLYFS